MLDEHTLAKEGETLYQETVPIYPISFGRRPRGKHIR